mmetsp:Transcript_20373/g.43668  ORF Transcript_20373/g.43668 Transcript_20373/m.43668 type:complete len:243 (-) Transcript_20373:1743-2471(-)
MSLVGQYHQPRLDAECLESCKVALALHRIRSTVLVRLAVDEQQLSDAFLFRILLHVHQRRHGDVSILRLPDRAVFRLKRHWSQRPVERAGASDARREQAGVRQEVRGHERPVGVPAHRAAVGVAHAALRHVVHRGLRPRHDLFYKGVVGLDVPLPDHGEGEVVHHDPPLGRPVYGRCPVRAHEVVLGSLHLPGRLGVLELSGVRPEEGGAGGAIVIGGQVEIGGELHAVSSFVLDQLLRDPQ